MKNRYVTASLLLVSLLAILPVSAAEDSAQAKKLQQMQRKFAQEKASLEGQLRDASGKLEESGKKADDAAARSAVLGGKLRRVEEENRRLSEVLAETRQKLEAENARLSAEGRKLHSELAAQKDSTATCEARSAKLYQYGDELLGLYVSKGAFTGLLQSEPFTGIKRIEVENVYEDYRDKLDQSRPPGVAASPPSPATPAAASATQGAAGS